MENVELTDPILQRFDVLCVLQDIVDPVIDEKLATFVVNSHVKSHPDANTGEYYDDLENDIDDNIMYGEDEEEANAAIGRTQAARDAVEEEGPQPLDQKVLKKYITYARAFCKPVLHDVDSEKIASLYSELRQQSAITGGIPIAVRHIESVMRMAEASAKMHLRDHVRDDDIDVAIKVSVPFGANLRCFSAVCGSRRSPPNRPSA